MKSGFFLHLQSAWVIEMSSIILYIVENGVNKKKYNIYILTTDKKTKRNCYERIIYINFVRSEIHSNNLTHFLSSKY